MMYLTRLTFNQSRLTLNWLANPYRVHQRLRLACSDEPRLLFRIEEGDPFTTILVQTHNLPYWAAAFNSFSVLAGLPEMKTFDPQPVTGQVYAFRLIANPTVKRDGDRIGLGKEEEQQSWLVRKLAEGGAELLRCQIQPYRIQHSMKDPSKTPGTQTHLVVQFDGLLRCKIPKRLGETICKGIGSAKGYGCGLLSLAPL